MAPIDVVGLSKIIIEYIQSSNESVASTPTHTASTETTSSVNSTMTADSSPLGPVYFILAYLLFNTFIIFSCMIVNGIYKKATDYELYKTYFGKTSTDGQNKKVRSRSSSLAALGALHPPVPQNLPRVQATRTKKKRLRLPKLHVRPPVSHDEEKEYNAVAWADLDDPRYREI